MNRYVVLARFDKNTEEKLIALRREMTNAGYASSEWPPHITLAAYEDLDAEALCDWTGEFVREHTRQKLTFGSVSLLPPYATHRETAVLCLNPVHAKPFVDFYYAFHEKYERHRQLLRRFGGQARHPLYAQRCAHHGAAGRARARLPK